MRRIIRAAGISQAGRRVRDRSIHSRMHDAYFHPAAHKRVVDHFNYLCTPMFSRISVDCDISSAPVGEMFAENSCANRPQSHAGVGIANACTPSIVDTLPRSFTHPELCAGFILLSCSSLLYGMAEDSTCAFVPQLTFTARYTKRTC